APHEEALGCRVERPELVPSVEADGEHVVLVADLLRYQVGQPQVGACADRHLLVDVEALLPTDGIEEVVAEADTEAAVGGQAFRGEVGAVASVVVDPGAGEGRKAAGREVL